MKTRRLNYSYKIFLIVLIFFMLFNPLVNSLGLNSNSIDKKIPITTDYNKFIFVDDSNTQGPWDGTIENPYQFIQDGINSASNGDTVFVMNGIYKETVRINKSIDLIGQDKNFTIIQGQGEMDGISITSPASGITITQFTIEKATMAGIYCEFSANNHITQNILKSNGGYGIWIHESQSNNIDFNKIYSSNVGIHIDVSSSGIYSGITNNDISNNNIGLVLTRASANVFYNNFISNKNQATFIEYYSNWDNNYWDNWLGLYLPFWPFNKIPKCIFGSYYDEFMVSFDRHPQKSPIELIML